MRRVHTLFLTMVAFSFSATLALADGMPAEEGEAPIEQKVQTQAVTQPVTADTLERANNEDLAAAIGHYARARSLLIAAVNEFDRGYKLARPDSLLDPKAWRSDVVFRAEDLEKVLSPQPRATRGGVKYEADTRLLNSEATKR